MELLDKDLMFKLNPLDIRDDIYNISEEFKREDLEFTDGSLNSVIEADDFIFRLKQFFDSLLVDSYVNVFKQFKDFECANDMYITVVRHYIKPSEADIFIGYIPSDSLYYWVQEEHLKEHEQLVSQNCIRMREFFDSELLQHKDNFDLFIHNQSFEDAVTLIKNYVDTH
jgi:hypothetical protein